MKATTTFVLILLVATPSLGIDRAPPPGGAHVAPIDRSATPHRDPTIVRGQVEDGTGAAVRSARVEFLSNGLRLAATHSDARGTFELRIQAPGPGPWALRIERLGYAPREIPLEGLDVDDLLVELEPAPLPLPGFEVMGDDPECRTPENAEARSFWAAARQRHRLDLDTLGVASYTLARTDTLTAAEVFGNALPVEALRPGQRGSAPLLRISWERRVDRQGYAFPVRRTNREGSFDSWSYAPLEADFAVHFLSDGFGRWHHLSDLEPSTSGGFDLRFCPTEASRPSLQGRLRFDADSLLVRAEWQFLTPDPDEGAGGWANFSVREPVDGPRLLPSESMVWRTLSDGRVQRRAQWYEGWILAPGDSVPFLPER